MQGGSEDRRTKARQLADGGGLEVRPRDASRLVNSILLTLTEHTLREQPFRRD